MACVRRLAAVGSCAALAGALVVSCGRSAARIEVLNAPLVEGAPRASDPAIVTMPDDGTVVMTWIGGDSTEWRLYAARSTDGGSSWSRPMAVTPPGEPVHPHGESSPRLLAASGGRTAVIWSTSQEVEGREWPASNVRFARSLDGGLTWGAPVTLNDDSLAAPAGHSFHGATLVGDSAIVVGWLDERPVGAVRDSESFDDASLFFVRSEDFGGRWAANRGLFSRVCPCCRVQVAATGGRAIAAWRKHYSGQIRDIVVASLDGPPSRVFTDDWEIAGCPHSGPAIAFESSGVGHIAWFSGAAGRTGVYYRRWVSGVPDSSTTPIAIEQGDRLPTSHVSVAATSGGAIVAYDLGAGGKRAVTLAELDESGRLIDRTEISTSDGALYPQAAIIEDGRHALVVWTSAERDGRQDLGLARVRLSGPIHAE
jgi:hypothetical protein